MPGMPAINNLMKPERVLTPSNTRSFDRLVGMLDRNGGRLDGVGRTPVTINIYAKESQSVYEIAKAVQREIEFQS